MVGAGRQIDASKGSAWGIIGGVIVGLIVGGGLVVLLAPGSASPRSFVKSSEAALTQYREPQKISELRSEINKLKAGAGAPADVAERLERLERALRDLEEKKESVSAPTHMPTDEDAAKAFEAQLVQHHAEVIDPEWGPQSSQLLNASLGKVSAYYGGYKAVSSSCGTSTCDAVIEWDSTDAARQGMRMAARAPLATNCPRRLVLNQEPEPDGKHRARFLLDCAEWRADGSKAFELGMGSEQTPASGGGMPR